MRLKSVTVRNYRLHRELTVPFDCSRTLIGGPNEVGKSTLAEAIHRALFLKAKGNTEIHRAMASTLHSGPPEVELVFEAGGQTCQLRKRFGTSGTTTLSQPNSKTISGDAAEEALARILKVEAGTSGKAVMAQWSHLWIWQGFAGEDPTTHATTQRDALVNRLQEMGASAVLQSDLDARVAAYFANSVSQIFTKAKNPKAGSDLEHAERDADDARKVLDGARMRVQKLETDADTLESANKDKERVEASLIQLKSDEQVLDRRAESLTNLREQEFKRRQVASDTRRHLDEVKGGNQSIEDRRTTIQELMRELKPQNDAVMQHDQALTSAKLSVSESERECRAASIALRDIRHQHDFAAACTHQFDLSDRNFKLSEKTAVINSRRQKCSGLETERAKFPDVDESSLGRLQTLEAKRASTHAALQAMAAGLEVLSTSETVAVNGQIAETGEKLILTEDTEVQIGSTFRLRITPGGGTTLADARQAAKDADWKLQQALDELAVPSVMEASQAFSSRRTLTNQIATLKAEIDGMDASEVEQELVTLKAELKEAEASVKRRSEQVLDLNAPRDQVEARALLEMLVKKLSIAQESDEQAQVKWDSCKSHLEATESALKDLQEAVKEKNKQHGEATSELNLLLKKHGEDEKRQSDLKDANSQYFEAANLLMETSDAIAVLQPELLDGDRDRIKRAITNKTDEQNALRTKIAVAQAALRSDGHEDPKVGFATAEAKARIAIAHHVVVKRKAEAIALLDQLFQKEQRELADLFTRPLAEKVTGYLQCIFGSGATAIVKMESNQFTGLQLVRSGADGAPYPFDLLSGGAREQVAAAVRLAVAEVLAADHDGCLPVVFDDAFAYSDPTRVIELQRMLDLAATRGLQVIVLTCNPTDYASLGARLFTLSHDLTRVSK